MNLAFDGRQECMELISQPDFISWAAARGIAPDRAYRESRDAPLAFVVGDPVWRRWLPPTALFNVPDFAWSLLGCAEPADALFVVVRGFGPWLTGSTVGTGPEWEHLRDRVVGTFPIPRDFRGALRFEPAEGHDVVLLMVTFLVYAWCVGDDLQIFPESGNAIVETSHHSDVIVRFRTAVQLESFISETSASGFPPATE